MKRKSDVIFVTPDSYLVVLLKLLEGARDSIDVLQFSFAIGSESGRIDFKGAPFKIAQLLKDLKKRKKSLRIRVCLEGRRETSGRNRITGSYLKAAGIDVRYGSSHAKGFCIDGRYLLIGSTNLTNQSILRNNEANLVIDDLAVAEQFTKYFNYRWKDGRHGGIHLDPPLFADGDFKSALIETINASKKQLEFSIYFFDHREIENALIAAHKRGVKIFGFLHNHKSFALSYVQRTRATAKRLRNAGIEHLYLGPIDKFSHSKFIIVDRKIVMLGTANWLVEDVITHPQLCVRLENQILAKDVSKYLRALVKREGDPL